MRGQKIRFFISFLLLVICGAADLILAKVMMHQENLVEAVSEQSAREVAKLIEANLASGLTIDGEAIRQIFRVDPQIGYIVIDDWLSGLRTGEINARAMIEAPRAIRDRLLSEDFETLANTLVSRGNGGAMPGFAVLQVELREKSQPKEPPKAMFKIGYVVPGYRQSALAKRACDILLFLFSLMTMICFVSYVALRRAHFALEGDGSDSSRPIEEVDLLDDSKTPSEIMSLSQPLDVVGEEWINMLHVDSVDSWQKRGSWYAISDFVLANPWRASLVRQDLNFHSYIYRLKAKRFEGVDGFIVLFTCDAKLMVWVLGGWSNTRSEVASIPETQVNESIEKDQWYDVTVEVLPEKLNGYLNGDIRWSLERKDIAVQDFSKDFLPGIGVGTWNSVCKFKDFYIVDKTPPGMQPKSQALDTDESAIDDEDTSEQTEIDKV